MCIQIKCQCYFSQNMGARARGQRNNFQLLSDRQWKWSSLASHKYWQIGQDLDANKKIPYTGLVSTNEHVSIWLYVCMCLYWVFFPVNGCCISTSVHVCACEERFRASSETSSSTTQIQCWHPGEKVLYISCGKTPEILYFKQKTSLPWQEIRSTWQQWKHQTPADHGGSAFVLGQG